jgi:hypothetical protein
VQDIGRPLSQSRASKPWAVPHRNHFLASGSTGNAPFTAPAREALGRYSWMSSERSEWIEGPLLVYASIAGHLTTRCISAGMGVLEHRCAILRWIDHGLRPGRVASPSRQS